MAFFLDFDGTLAELAPHPNQVRLSARAYATLSTIEQVTGGALALISGRSIWDLDRHVAPLRLPIAGQHGAERRTRAGDIVSISVNPRQVQRLARQVETIARRDPRLELERKGFSVALHYRSAPELETAIDAELAALLADYEEDFAVLPGKMVREVKPRGSHKGEAIAAYMTEAPFLGRLPVFAGDDRTDEDGFAAVQQFGGLSIKIGEGETRAQYRLADSIALVAWLEQVGQNLVAAAR